MPCCYSRAIAYFHRTAMLILKRRFSAEHYIDSFGGGIRCSGTRRVAVRFCNMLIFCSLPLASLSGCHLLVECHRLIPGYAQRFPSRAGEVPCQQDDLPHMKPIMRYLAVDSLHDRVCDRFGFRALYECAVLSTTANCAGFESGVGGRRPLKQS